MTKRQKETIKKLRKEAESLKKKKAKKIPKTKHRYKCEVCGHAKGYHKIFVRGGVKYIEGCMINTCNCKQYIQMIKSSK